MSEDGIREHCPTCAVAAQCKAAFGDYWQDKSHGGVGCYYPLPAIAKPRAAETPAAEIHPEPVQEQLAPAAEPTRREPWEIAHTTRGRSAGVLCTRKRNGMGRARQGRFL